MNLTDAPIVKARVLSINADGSGVVEIPITVESPTVDFSRTAGGGPKNGSITLADLQEMESNLSQVGKPMSVGFDDPLSQGHERDKHGPQDAWLEGVRLDGPNLWGRIKVSAARLAQLLADKWRSFSIEAARDYNDLSKQFSGWVLRGGTFTNNPALRVHFAFSESGEPLDGEVRCAAVNFRLDTPARPLVQEPEERVMSDSIALTLHEEKMTAAKRELALANERAASLETQLAARDNERQTIRTENETLGSSVRTLGAENTALKAMQTTHDALVATLRKANDKLQDKIVELTNSLEEAQSAATGTEVRSIIEEAIEKGVPPAVFSGYDSDPAAWVKANYASVDSFKSIVAALRGVSKSLVTKPVKSGVEEARKEVEGETAVALTDEEKALFGRLGIGSGEFVGVTSEAEARKRFEAARAAKKGNN